MEYWPERAPQAPPYLPAGRQVGGVKGHNTKDNTLPGSPALVGGKIQMIGDIRDTIQHWLVDQYKIVDELEFYP